MVSRCMSEEGAAGAITKKDMLRLIFVIYCSWLNGSAIIAE